MTVTEKQIDMLKAAAFDEHALLQQAYVDAIEEFSRFAMRGRTTRDAITLLENWRMTFARAGRHG